MIAWLRRVWCVLNGGHFLVRHYESERFAERCVACGHVTRGWSLSLLEP